MKSSNQSDFTPKSCENGLLLITFSQRSLVTIPAITCRDWGRPRPTTSTTRSGHLSHQTCPPDISTQLLTPLAPILWSTCAAHLSYEDTCPPLVQCWHLSPACPMLTPVPHLSYADTCPPLVPCVHLFPARLQCVSGGRGQLWKLLQSIGRAARDWPQVETNYVGSLGIWQWCRYRASGADWERHRRLADLTPARPTSAAE